MRLIDADALIHELNNSHYPGAPYVDAGISIAIGKICDAPTIEERNTGRWVELGQNKDGTHNLCCGACGKFKFKSKGHANSQYTKERYKFCGGCGAKMEVSK